MKTYTTKEIIAPFSKLITETHTIVFDRDERSGWYSWTVYTNEPLKAIGGGSHPTFVSAIEFAMQEYKIDITY
jgi:hypothetical protein